MEVEMTENYSNVKSAKGKEHDAVYETLHWCPGHLHSGIGPAGERSPHCRRAAALLGLVCVLLLSVVIGLCSHYNGLIATFRKTATANYTMERDHWQTRLDNLTAERDHLLSLLSQEQKKSACPQGWMKAQCYYFSNKEFLSSKQKDFWMGLSDAGTEGVWRWVDGRTLGSGSWKSGEPNDAQGGEDCAVSTLSGWNDIPCSTPLYWVCESLRE